MKHWLEEIWWFFPTSLWKGVAIVLFLASFVVLMPTVGFIFGEGPHGPNGAITQDPDAEWAVPLLFNLAGLCFVSGMLIGSSAIRRDRTS